MLVTVVQLVAVETIQLGSLPSPSALRAIVTVGVEVGDPPGDTLGDPVGDPAGVIVHLLTVMVTGYDCGGLAAGSN